MAITKQAGLTFTVNGQSHEVRAAPDTLLIYVLRNDLRLNAAKFGRGLSECVSCTVLVDGEAARSCIYSVSDTLSKRFATREGPGGEGHLHPLPQAFLDEQAAQCGYCISA